MKSLKEIQQQRAAQMMMDVFNQIKPNDMQHSPRWVRFFIHVYVHVSSASSVHVVTFFSIHQIYRCFTDPSAF